MRKFQTHSVHYSDWKVPIRYQHLKLIGHGAQGSVCSALDTELGIDVAIKKPSNPFHSCDSAKRTYREMKITHHLDHENVICLIDVFTSSLSRDNFQDVYFVSPFLNTDLSKIICNEDSMNKDNVCFLIYQIVRALKYIHSTGIIHRDLAPKNIAVNEDNMLRILDFGLSRKKNDFMTGYVISRHYRAPESIFRNTNYTNKGDSCSCIVLYCIVLYCIVLYCIVYAVDMWSVGCIMAEMIIHRVLFPGEDQMDQLRRIMEIADLSNEEFWNKICSEDEKAYFLDTVALLPPIEFTQFFYRYTDDFNAIDLLRKMLTLDPDNRISATDALKHPYLATYCDESDEPNGEPFLDDLESDSNLNIEVWKDGIWNFIENFVPRITNLIQNS